MSGALLPKMQPRAGIGEMKPGAWTPIQTPGELVRLDYGTDNGQGLRNQVQSIPSPWSRMLLFRAAMEDPAHPARDMVTNDWLDAVEVLWESRRRGLSFTESRLAVDDLERLATTCQSARVEAFARALKDLRPSSGAGALNIISILSLGGRPVLASSPFTLLFTAEDARHVVPSFTYSDGGDRRPLKKRPPEFQRYVARVLVPQIKAMNASTGDGATIRQLLGGWLKDEMKNAGFNYDDEGGDWRQAAAAMKASLAWTTAGVQLYHSSERGASRWQLRPTRQTQTALPIVVVPSQFDGYFYEGAAKAVLGPDVSALDRARLPGSGVQWAWVLPQHDWLPDHITLAPELFEPGSVLTPARVTTALGSSDPVSIDRMLMPLRAAYFAYFTPQDALQNIAIDIGHDRTVTVRLDIPIGTEDDPGLVTIQRTYGPIDPALSIGPNLAIWPAINAPNVWTDYLLFRQDATDVAAASHRLVPAFGGRALEVASQKRTPLVTTTWCKGLPEVVELVRSSPVSADASGGVILPRFQEVASSDEAGSWSVGIDFGTSNTVVAVRADDGKPVVLAPGGQLLPITRLQGSTRELLDAYFFTPEIPSGPFGTAAVHVDPLPSVELAGSPLGLYLTIPFQGHVDAFQRSRVRGDLKWSLEESAFYITTSFLRHLTAIVVVAALARGVSPRRVSIRYAYPRAFDEGRRSDLKHMWTEVLEALSATGLSSANLQEPLDESVSVLSHLLQIGEVSSGGSPSAIIDIGGGTSDIALYGGGLALALDSLLIGGRNLTGAREQAASQENPIVSMLHGWMTGLSDTERRAIEKYRRDGQEHLAFGYLIASGRFSANSARFAALPQFRGVQAAILYMLGGLFHYVGLLARATNAFPARVVLGGNGSRFVHWLSRMEAKPTPPPTVHACLTEILGAASGQPTTTATEVRVSQSPKEEVARGLASKKVEPDPSRATPLIGTSLGGERVRWPLGEKGEVIEVDVTSPLPANATVLAARVSELQWTDGQLEIERYHAALVRACGHLEGFSQAWNGQDKRFEAFFKKHCSARQVMDQSLMRLQLRGQHTGSMFALEMTVVLDQIIANLGEL